MVIYLLLIAHLVADFTFQSDSLAMKKIHKGNYLVIHSVIYAVVLVFAFLVFIKFQSAILPCLVVVFSHFIIDWIKAIINRKTNKKAVVFFSFLFDQFLHISIIIMVYYFLNIADQTNQIYAYFQTYIYFNTVVIYLLIFLIIWDPAAVFIRMLFTYIISDETNEKENSNQRVGRLIGKLERTVIFLLAICNQLGAIGLVLTAKSIARYKQLENKDFAEKYLVGTLTSTIIALITTILLKSLA